MRSGQGVRGSDDELDRRLGKVVRNSGSGERSPAGLRERGGEKGAERMSPSHKALVRVRCRGGAMERWVGGEVPVGSVVSTLVRNCRRGSVVRRGRRGRR